MSNVHLLSSAEAQKELTEAVKETQGSTKTASWKAAAQPCWWINEHTVTLRNGITVSTGTFDVAAKRKWRKSHFQAALFLYHQWVQGSSTLPNSKEEAKIEEEITPAPRMTTRAKKEEEILPARVPRKKSRAKGKQKVVEEIPDAGKPQPEEEVEEEKEIEVQEPTRSRRNLRFKDESAIPKENSPVPTPKTRSHRRNSSSSMESDKSPSPIIRRRRKATGRREVQKTSPRIQSPIPKRQLKTRRARNGKALVRSTAKTEVRRESIPRSHGSADNDPASGAASSSDDDFYPIRTRRRANLVAKVTSPTVQDNRRMSTHSSGISTRGSPSPDSPITRKRLISECEGETRTEQPRTLLQERNDPSNIQDKRSRKKRRTSDSDDAPSDKENRTPQTVAKSKSTRLRPARGKKGKSGEPEVDPTETENVNKDNGNKEQEDVDGAAEQRRKAKGIKFLRDQIAEVKAERDRQLGLIDRHFANLEEKSNDEKRTIVHNLRMEYRMRKLRFSKQILDMPVSKFADKHGGDIDEWMMHETEEGVNKTFQALHNGEDPNDRVMGPPKTPTAMSRRAALTKTARKTRRKVDNEAAAAGLTVRRSQRTAAKVATERTRAIVASTPRTVKKEVTIQVNGHAAAPVRTTRGVRPVAVTGDEEVVCSRQQLENLGRSIRQHKNPIEAFREFTSQLQREAFAK